MHEVNGFIEITPANLRMMCMYSWYGHHDLIAVQNGVIVVEMEVAEAVPARVLRRIEPTRVLLEALAVAHDACVVKLGYLPLGDGFERLVLIGLEQSEPVVVHAVFLAYNDGHVDLRAGVGEGGRGLRVRARAQRYGDGRHYGDDPHGGAVARVGVQGLCRVVGVSSL